MLDLFNQYMRAVPGGWRVVIFVAVAGIVILLLTRLIVSVLRGAGRGIKNGATCLSIDGMVRRIQHTKDAEKRMHLIDNYNRRVQELSEAPRKKGVPKALKIILRLLILAALALAVLVVVKPELEISQQVWIIYAKVEDFIRDLLSGRLTASLGGGIRHV